ncbi:MAG: GAF domain-containing protein [Candidatus Eremiobacteraeota bacterium]|nr:GAF domain-containing protein [Candidatus Eremiobacteraeota bacterium]
MHGAEEHERRYKALLGACTCINSTLDLTALLETITRQTMEIMEAEASSLLLVEPGGRYLTFRVAIGEVASMLKDVQIKTGEGIAGTVALSGKPLLIHDARKEPRFFAGVDEQTGFTTKTLLCAPLMTKKRIHGVIEVINKKDEQLFDERDMDFLMAMANQAAIAIENALLYQQISTEKNRVESILKSMSDGVVVVNEQGDVTMMNPSARTIFELDRGDSRHPYASYQKLSFLLNEVRALKKSALFDIVMMKPENTILSNNVTLLKTPEGADEGAVMVLRNITENKDKEIMRSEYLTLLTYKTFAPLENLLLEIDTFSQEIVDAELPLRRLYELEKNVKVIKSFVQKLHYFSELEAGPLRLEKSRYRLNDLIEEAIFLSKEEFEEMKIDAVVADSQGMVHVDGNRIIEAIMLIISFIHSVVPSEDIAVELIEEDDFYEILIRNSLPDDLLPKISNLFASHKLIEELCRLHVGGEGIQLLECAFVKHLLDAHGGTILIEKREEKDIMVINLPRDKGE